MRLVRSALLAAAASMLAVAAFAQDESSRLQPAPPAHDTDMSAQPPADASATTGMATDASATVDANGVIHHASQPIPDTPANRAAYGQPLSRAGKMSPPVGN